MKKALIIVVATVLVCTAAICGTLAWLNDSTATVTNTFTVGEGISIKLEETTEDYVVVPGAKIAKDPTVTVTSNGDGCWLFVKVESTLPSYVTYAINSAWTAVPGVDGVYYIENAAETAYPVLEGNVVNVDSNVSDVSSAKNTTLAFTAYAIQDDAATTAAEAWAAMLVELA
ncbi:MAG: hypothetical protein IKU52_08445 [Clostridia bacterium]|nr:hypothetical protein [Clostridia bacterium]